MMNMPPDPSQGMGAPPTGGMPAPAPMMPPMPMPMPKKKGKKHGGKRRKTGRAIKGKKG